MGKLRRLLSPGAAQERYRAEYDGGDRVIPIRSTSWFGRTRKPSWCTL
jgi:hypothetical protein